MNLALFHLFYFIGFYVSIAISSRVDLVFFLPGFLVVPLLIFPSELLFFGWIGGIFPVPFIPGIGFGSSGSLIGPDFPPSTDVGSYLGAQWIAFPALGELLDLLQR